jgi:hypothetical protein
MPPSTIIGDPLWWAPRIARAVLKRWGRSPAIEPVPVSEPPTDKEIEEAAKLIYASMRFAHPDRSCTRDWVERGNSLMQDEARRTARAVLERRGHRSEPPTDEELDQLWDEEAEYFNLYGEARCFARAVLERWGHR